MSGSDDGDPVPDEPLEVTFSGPPTHVSEKIEFEPSGKNFTTTGGGFDQLASPRRLGRYTLTHLIGKGGMAEVYLAKQDGPAGFEKTVVVKRIRPVLLEEPKFVEMFLREARIAARLNHTNVVQIFELGQSGTEYFIAMEFLDGITLHRAARRSWAMQHSIPMEVVLKCVADAALGLHYAHNLRASDGSPSPLVHRDISPDNLLVTRDGTTKVLDFGIAKDASMAAEHVTMTGEIKGKVPFLSPEQIRGDNVDGRADMWALGVTLFWLLTGRRPFDGKSDHMTIDNILRTDPPSVRELNPLVPVDIDRLTLSLLTKNPRKRLGTGLELNKELVTILGPAASASTTSTFAVEIMESPTAEKQVAPGEVITVIAARPITAWLQRVSDNSQGGVHYENLLPEPTPVSSGGATFTSGPDPVTTSRTGELAELREEVIGAPRGRPMLLAAAATAIAAGALLGALLFGGGDGPEPDKVVLPTPPSEVRAQGGTAENGTAGNAAASGTAATGDPVQDDDATRDAQAGGGTKAPGVDEVADDGAAEDSAADDSAADDSAAGEAAELAASAKAEADDKPNRKRPSGKRVQVAAPSKVVWLDARGRRLGKGTGSITVRPNTTFVTAWDTSVGARTRVPIADKLDYAKLPSGRLSVRVRPWAKVYVGRKLLGTTPLDPVRLIAGTYRVRFEQDAKKAERTVEVKAGGHATIKIDMGKE